MEEKIKEVALLPCPFCGGEAWMEIYSDRYRVRCKDCGAEGPGNSFPAFADKAWNRRAEPQKDAEPAAYILTNGEITQNEQTVMAHNLRNYCPATPLFLHPQPKAATVPEVTDAMALAFHRALTDGSIGQGEVDEIKQGLRAALEAAPSLPAAEDAQGWKNAVEDELVICGILNESHKDPRKAVKDVIAWNVQVALDPLVSEVARDAARYRFLRHADLDAVAAAYWPNSDVPEGEAFDRAIDAAMQDSGKGEV